MMVVNLFLFGIKKMTELLREKSNFPEVVGFGNFVISFIKVIGISHASLFYQLKILGFFSIIPMLSPANLLTGLFIKSTVLISFVYVGYLKISV